MATGIQAEGDIFPAGCLYPSDRMGARDIGTGASFPLLACIHMPCWVFPSLGWEHLSHGRGHPSWHMDAPITLDGCTFPSDGDTQPW
jgi:hypothetical protein